MDDKKLTPGNIFSIEAALGRGDRVELIPVKEGVRVLRIRREEMPKHSGKLPGKP